MLVKVFLAVSRFLKFRVSAALTLIRVSELLTLIRVSELLTLIRVYLELVFAAKHAVFTMNSLLFQTRIFKIKNNNLFEILLKSGN